ncbi:MAG: hypothetical protein ACP6IU_00295 [Candidatus Asgardarchaeia archaeon]
MNKIKKEKILYGLIVNLEASILMVVSIFASYAFPLPPTLVSLINAVAPILIIVYTVQLHENILDAFISLFVIALFFMVFLYILLVSPTFFGLVDNVGYFYGLAFLDSFRNTFFIFIYSLFGYFVGLIVRYVTTQG